MSDFGFRRPLRGSNSGVRTKNTLSPARLLDDPTAYLDKPKEQETQGFILVRATLRCNTLLQCVVDCLEGLRMN